MSAALHLAVSNEITLADVRASKFKLLAHLNYGSKGAKYLYESVAFPRLTITDTYIKQERRTVRAAYVDGERRLSWAEVVAALNSPSTS